MIEALPGTILTRTGAPVSSGEVCHRLPLQLPNSRDFHTV